MKLLGCFKIVADMEVLESKDWEVADSLFVELGYVRPVWNCFDESALEMLLKLSDLSEGFNVLTDLWAMTIGGKNADSYLKTLYALGYEKAVRIESEEDLRFRPEWIAGIITAYVRKFSEIDGIVMGSVSSDGNNGVTPLLTAEALGWPCITQVIEMQPVDERHIRVTNMQEDGRATRTVALPCVFAVGNAASSYLRVPTLKDRMKKGKKPIEYWKAEELSGLLKDYQEGIELQKLFTKNQSRQGIRIQGKNAREKAEVLYRDYLKERLEAL